jgi:uncharacterized protein (DUF58 family)
VSPTPTWDPEVLARIGALQLRARQAVAGYLHGGHVARRISSNVEFADYKEYAPGDPLRDLDWRVAGRSDRLVVRRHQAETEQAVTLVVDASGDLATGAHGRYPRDARPPFDGTKWGYAAVLTATLAWWLEHHHEPVGLLVLGGEDVRWKYLPPQSGGAHLARILGVLAETRPAGKADIGARLNELGGRVRGRSLVVLISDLMEEPDTWGPTLATLLARRADLRVVHLHDSAEWAFDMGEAAVFQSPEGGPALAEDPAEVRDAFLAERDAFLESARNWLGSIQAQLIPAPTDQPMEPVLTRLLRGI